MSLEETILDAIDELDKLAKLGNEPYYGNSFGNNMAYEIKEKLQAAIQTHNKYVHETTKVRYIDMSKELEILTYRVAILEYSQRSAKHSVPVFPFNLT